MLNVSIKKSNAVGILSSGLCMIHCIATPFLFLATATTCSQTCCDAAPVWYQWFDYFFLFVSFFAVAYSSKSSNSNWVKYALWFSWISLFLFILNSNFFGWYSLAQNIKFIPSFSLIGLHLYNLKYCQSKEVECC